ncbi:putative ATP-dependent DEAD/H RNA helicase [Trypanosoma cruzi]|uniref:Putative ATP-dependent DEAD/H RNA helicase n=1 Tax=Trypanosoma cruzi TaxID=5693 RepID=A0A2V2W326_TRYCR|nr:putative ATP-dependent DEAD/H RNA helicase [Trypanosoma cruzi]
MPHEAGCIPCVRTLYRQRERDQWLLTGNEAAAAANRRMIMRLVSFHHLTTLHPKGEPHVNAEHSHLRVHCYSTCREAGWSRQRLTWRRCEVERWSRPNCTVCVPIVHAGARRALQRAYKPFSKFVCAHIGHVAHGFLLGKRPGDVWAQLQSFIGEDAKTAREASSFDTREGGRGCEGFRGWMRLQLEVLHDDWPRGVIVRKQRRVTCSTAGRGIGRRLARSEERSDTPTKQEANVAMTLVKCFPWDELRCFSHGA